jgi:hypothetical protein
MDEGLAKGMYQNCMAVDMATHAGWTSHSESAITTPQSNSSIKIGDKLPNLTVTVIGVDWALLAMPLLAAIEHE